MDKERLTPAQELDAQVYVVEHAIKESPLRGVAWEAWLRVLDALALERRGRVYAEKRLDEIRKAVGP